ncbi:MAG: hypothetical protein NC548_23515 [Lachnospiraceae bacterium]|nr:hypothetical protein [Lachnospiraceae bacterium]
MFSAGNGAERLLEGKDAEGSFRAGGPRADRRMWTRGQPACVSSHGLSTLQDRTLAEVAENAGSDSGVKQRWYRVDDALCRQESAEGVFVRVSRKEHIIYEQGTGKDL